MLCSMKVLAPISCPFQTTDNGGNQICSETGERACEFKRDEEEAAKLPANSNSTPFKKCSCVNRINYTMTLIKICTDCGGRIE